MGARAGSPQHEPDWGRTADGAPVGRWVLSVPGPRGDVRVALADHGARLQSVVLPGRDGREAEVLLGFDGLDPYAGKGRSFGATIGRFANRIAGGRFELDGETHEIPPTDRGNAIHGGPHPFSEKVWAAEALEGAGGPGVRFVLVSPDGDNGFPGTLRVQVDYVLLPTDDGATIRMTYEAAADAPTVVNLTNHAYWNLAGDGSGTVDGHVVTVAAERFLPVDETGLPTGELRGVAGTPFDFRTPRAVGERVDAANEQLLRGKGYDHCFVLSEHPGGTRPVDLAVTVEDPGSGRVLQVATDQPGVQVFSGGSLSGTLVGRAGTAYGPRAGLAVETQAFPDSPNRPEFPSTVLRPGEVFRSTTEFRLSAR
ncbi:aldose 1-epimerase [Kineococcus xinjiangensis]|uniref:Aldose 1-epimerase n=1 Tax=Kineococcus xinjiangensis TaxID=512762 RepID=A0A2S6IG29_9ACTN|nr:aldose epimerase family protein [Kineococcus xinjiangensis]PPK93147.1 aldose 1-epimerase [Kineococcus xinjiangensis]